MFYLYCIGYADEGQLWRELYEIPNDGLEMVVNKLYEEVKPMYQQLHAFIRRRLAEQYPGRVNTYGPIPAHLFGKIRDWENEVVLHSTPPGRNNLAKRYV